MKRVSWQELQSYGMWVREWYPHPMSPMGVPHCPDPKGNQRTRNPADVVHTGEPHGVQSRAEEDREWLWRDKRKTSNE